MENFYKQHENILKVIDDLIQEGLENHNKEVSCENGCFYCCTFPIPVGILELLYIAKKVNSFSQEMKDIIIDNIEISYKYSFRNDQNIKQAYFSNSLKKHRTVCPFINNGSCMIYEFRPINCRTQFSTNVNLCQRGNGDLDILRTPKVGTLVSQTSQIEEKGNPKKGFLHNAFIFDGDQIQVDPVYIFDDDLDMDNQIKLSDLINLY